MLLRLESAPDPSASNTDVAESWREPPQALRLIVSDNVEGSPPATGAQSLEDEIRKLKALESELEVLQSLIAQQKKLIHSRLRKEAQDVSQELSNCDGLSCIFKTVAHKAIDAWRVAYIRYNPGQKPITMGRPEHIFPQAHDHVAQVAQVSDDSVRVSTPTPQPYKAEAVC